MTPEWEEIKEFIRTRTFGNEALARVNILGEMDLIEKRTLSERVAVLIRNLDHQKWTDKNILKFSERWCERMANVIATALETGDTSELENWQRKI